MNIIDYLSQRFINYCESVPREEIFVHTDREEYIAGEYLWFNIYLVDRQSFNSSLNSKIAYFELLNPENHPVIQRRFRIDKGFGPGQIELPDSLSSGTYILRVYTSWMKNFLPDNCFMKDIKVYNALNIKYYNGRAKKPDVVNDLKNAVIPNNISDPGLTLNVNNLKPDSLEIVVHADGQYRSQNNQIFYLFIQTHGLINQVSPEKITGENTLISIPKKLLTPGINHISIFDSKGLPICERFIYTPERELKQVLAIRTIDSCGTRSKVSLEFEIKDKLSATLNATNLSISVAPETNTPGKIDLDDYLVFGTEFGPEPMKTIKGRKINEIPPEEIDNLLSKVKSNWINWRDILSVDRPQYKYQVEKEEHFITGSLLTSDQQLAHPGEFLIMSTPGKEPVFQYTTTDYEASFSFSIHIDQDLNDLIIQPDDTTKNNKIYIESPFSDKYFPGKKSVDSTGKLIPDYFPKWSANYQVRRIYETSSAGELLHPNFPLNRSRKFYGKPDVEIVMKDYIKLPTMEEIFFELIPSVNFKSKKSGYEIAVVNPYLNRIYENPPVVMIDGIKINDLSVVANLDPELVEKIDIVQQMYHVGDYLFYGIVNIITKTGDFSSVTLPGYAVRMQYRVTEPIRAFVSPDYTSVEMKNSRTPDFRNTLYWNPSVRPDKDCKARIEFWTSDITSDYDINIQGITGDGKTVSLKKIIKIYKGKP